MANNIPVYDDTLGDDLTLMASDYAVARGGVIKIRGSKYIDFDANFFAPEAARRLAHYILELADDADRKPELEDLKADLAAAYVARYRYGVPSITDMLADSLHKLGYHK